MARHASPTIEPGEAPPRSRVLVMGAGGLGGITAAHLTLAGHAVEAVARRRAVVEAVRRRGFRLLGEGPPREVPGTVHLGRPPDGARYDTIILSTQPTDVEEAARLVVPHLAPGGRLVCLQNGLCEDRVAAVAGGDARVVGAIVSWAASAPEPGVYERTSRGAFTVGRMGGAADAGVREVAALLSAVAPARTTDNLRGARWSKLALNCAISSLSTLAGERLGTLVLRSNPRQLALGVMTEAVVVARALGVRLEKVAGTLDLEWIALTEAEARGRRGPRLAAKHALLLLVGARYRRLRSSMLAAIERGRPPAVDFLNGEVVARARRLGIPVPLNEAIVALVWRVARGEAQPGRPLLRELAAAPGA